MGKLVAKWEEARDDLGIEIVTPYRVEIGPGKIIHAQLLVRNFGARRGMLIVSDYQAIKPYAEQLVKLGYGYSVLEDADSDMRYDRDAFVHMLSDWTWSGPEDQRPAWVLDVVE